MTRDEQLLIYRAVDGLVTPEEFDALQSLLAADDEALAFYCSQANMNGFLEYHSRITRQLPLAESRKAALARKNKRRRQRLASMAGIAALIAVLLAAGTALFLSKSPEPRIAAARKVASFQVSPGSVWRLENGVSGNSGELLAGDRFELEEGRVELQYANGMRTVVRGPSHLVFTDELHLQMDGGTAYFDATKPEAHGFRVSLDKLEVVDLGTRFGVSDADKQAPEVHVFTGSVSLRRRHVEANPPRVLNAGEGVRDMPGHGGFLPITARSSLFDSRIHDGPEFIHLDFNRMDEDGSLVVSGTEPEVSARAFAHAGGTVRLEPGVAETAAKFDGSGSYIRVGGWDGISGMEARTVAFWCKTEPAAPEEIESSQSLVSWGNEGNLKRRWEVVIDSAGRKVSGAARVATGASEAVCGSKFIADGNWRHIAVVFDPDKGSRLDQAVSIYVDGRLERVSHATPSPVDTMKSGEIVIGRHINHSTLPELAFNGSIDELYVFRAALPGDEIRRLAANQSPSWIHPDSDSPTR